MRTSLATRARVVILSTASCAIALSGVYACAPDDENPASPSRNRGGNLTADGAPIEGQTGIQTTALDCNQYGGAEQVNALAASILDSAKNDCRISPAVNEALGERGAHVKECFGLFMQSAFRCGGATFTLGKTEDSKGDACNSQVPGLKLSEKDYVALNEDTKAVVEGKGFTAAQVKDMAIVLQNAKLQLVTNDEVPRGKYTQCAANCSSGGEDCDRPQPEGGNPNPPPPPPPPDSGTPDSGGGGEEDAG